MVFLFLKDRENIMVQERLFKNNEFRLILILESQNLNNLINSFLENALNTASSDSTIESRRVALMVIIASIFSSTKLFKISDKMKHFFQCS